MKKTYIQPMMQVLGLWIESQMLGGSDKRVVTEVDNDDGLKMKKDGIWGDNTLR